MAPKYHRSRAEKSSTSAKDEDERGTEIDASNSLAPSGERSMPSERMHNAKTWAFALCRHKLLQSFRHENTERGYEITALRVEPFALRSLRPFYAREATKSW